MADASLGLVDDLSIGKALLPQNAVRKAVNVQFDRPRGGVRQRMGYTKLGDDLTTGSNRVLGLHNHRNSNASYNALLGASTTIIYKLVNGVWTSKSTGLTTGLKTRFLSYLNTVAAMNGTDGERSSADGGNTWVTTGGNLDIGNMPTSKFAVVLNTRVLCAGDSSNPDTVSLSSLMSGGAVSWTSGNKTVQVNPNDGAGGITGLSSTGRLALIFKERGLYRYDDNDLQRIGFVGTPSHESICQDDQGLVYFFGQGANGVGFYRTSGGLPEKVSRAITKYVEAITASGYSDICGYSDGNKVRWDVGDLTIDGAAISNVSLVFSVSDKTWTAYSSADRFYVFSQYINSDSEITVVGGDASSEVHTMDSGHTDNTTAISSEVEFAPVVFTTRGRVKTIGEAVGYCESFQGLRAHVKADDGDFMPMGDFKEYTQQMRFPAVRGHEFFFKLTATNSGEPWEFSGFEFGSVADDGYSNV